MIKVHNDIIVIITFSTLLSLKKLRHTSTRIRFRMLTANSWNVCQYAVLMHMFAQASGLKVGELVHVIADAHIYDRHIPIVERMLERAPAPAPRLIIDSSVTDFYAFTPDSFRLDGYTPAAFEEKIPIAI